MPRLAEVECPHAERVGLAAGHKAYPPLDLDCAGKAYKLDSRSLAGKVYPHEIGFQETRTNHRKLDSQATLSHRARGRTVDGLRPQAWPLRAPRCDDDPGRLPPRPAGLGGLRPAVAADRTVRGPPARSPRQERHSQACTRSGVTRCGLSASYDASTLRTPTYSFPSAAGQSAPSVSTASSSASARPPRCHSRYTRTCFAMPVGSNSQMMATTRGPCSITSDTRTSSTRSGTPKWHLIASRTFGETDDCGAGSIAPHGRSSRSKKTTRHIVEITRPLAVASCAECAPSGRPRCRPPSSGGSSCVFAWAPA